MFDPVQQELRDRERFMQTYMVGSSGSFVSVWDLYQSYKEALAADNRIDCRCSRCGRHRNQVGSLSSVNMGPLLCEECRDA